MIVRDFDIHLCTMRKEDPNWRFALGANPVTDGQVLRIATDDGIEGFGYASATPHMGSIQATLQAELELFRPFVIGRDPRGIEAILIELDRCIRGAPQAKAAVDCALHDLLARSLGAAEHLFGGPVRDSVPILQFCNQDTTGNGYPSRSSSIAVTATSRSRCMARLGRRRAGGVIRRQVGDDIHLTIDANQSYSPKTLSQRFTACRSTASIWSNSRFPQAILPDLHWSRVWCRLSWRPMSPPDH